MNDIENRSLEINLDSFHNCIDTWVPQEDVGYRLYANEDLTDGHSNEYFLTQYSWKNRQGKIIQMGYCEITPKSLNKTAVNKIIKEKELTELSDGQWKTVVKAYEDLCNRVLPDVLFEGVPQLYKTHIYHEINDMQAAMEKFIDDVHRGIEKYAEYEEDNDKDWYDKYETFTRLGDDQYHYIGEILEQAISWEDSKLVPYAEHCQLAATLEFEPYENWELRAIEHLHNGILANKPELAKTKALLEKGLSQTDIVEKLDKSPSTVSRQVAAITEWEKRASWSIQQEQK
jgi:hypothetical protein